MKYIITIFLATISLLSFAQNKDIDTTTFHVEGICGMCKDRIENAAYIKGVKKVTWDKETKILTVVYKPSKVTPQQIGQSVADAGHDNDYAKASAEAYSKIHDCCTYRETESH
jgi:copper chaperone CopZ